MASRLMAVALAPALVFSAPALACKCASVSREATIARTPYVYEGRVLRVRVEDGFRYANIEMTRPVKGAVPRIMEVATPADEAACGVRFRPGETLTVGATLSEAQFHADSCTIRALNPGRF